MNIVYNTQEKIASDIKDFLLKVFPNMRKTQLKIIPYIIIGMINAESSVASDIAKKLKDDFSLVQHQSVVKRIKRLFVNKFFNPYDFYDKIIRFVLSTYKKKHDDKNVHIIFDHMFSRDNYTVFMITMRIGKQGIPLWFRCFMDKDCPDAFKISLLKEGISYVSSLFDNSYKLTFLADRWFNSAKLLKHISSLGHFFTVRLKKNMKILVYDNKEKHKIWKSIDDLTSTKFHARYFTNIEFTEERFVANITITRRKDLNEPWILITNDNPKFAARNYSYRFGAIECLFKSQKSNGFYIESTVNASLTYFTSMYTLTCFSVLFLTIAGADYTKNKKCYKDVKIVTHKIINGVKKRVLSVFNTGLTLFNLAFNSSRYIRIPFSFKLYDL